MARLCPRHPKEPAARACRACGRPICRRCEFRAGGRLFCGPGCARSTRPNLPVARAAAAAGIAVLASGIVWRALLARRPPAAVAEAAPRAASV
ncbi:MAG: B-box zinc finger protein, partial [Thermoanaerobaculia bacterium]